MEKENLLWIKADEENTDNDIIEYELVDTDNNIYGSANVSISYNLLVSYKSASDISHDDMAQYVFRLIKILNLKSYFKISKGTFAVGNNTLFLGDDAIQKCPDDMVFDFVLLSEDSSIKHWKWNVNGDLYAFRSNLQTVKEGITIQGCFHMQYTKIKEMNCTVGKDLIADKSDLISFNGIVEGHFLAYDKKFTQDDEGHVFIED
ncbi:hypothetical protein JK182_01245 [Acetobacter okinawensis]|uniref:hypothetical protein n=1 Tax=Acetobacter okinawensis TaxID=1076594 RepID=UPI001BABE0A6|nr:hypothetical protein [Acetobacter okinawensis]MBS0987317.1 hypothetical protein [Acetobacter okinawensis]